MTKSITITVGVHEAKTRLSELLRLVEAGEEIEIARGGKPVAKLVPSQPKRKRKLGTARGQFVVPDDFDDPMPEFEADFYA